jgi:hypothetical protein
MPRQNKRKDNLRNTSKPRLSFLKANVATKESLDFYKKFLGYFGYKITHDRGYCFSMSNGQTEFLVYPGANIDPRGIYVGSIGVSGVYFEVKNRNAVDRFNRQFIKQQNIEPLCNYCSPKRKYREIYFFNKERTGFSIFSDPKNRNKKIIESNIKRLGIRVVNEESLNFHKSFLMFLGYKLIGEYKDDEHNVRSILVGNNELVFEIYIMDFAIQNKAGSGIYNIDAGINAFFLKVSDKEEVDKFIGKFLKPNKVNFRFNNENCREEGNYSIFFTTPEKLTIGIVSD